MAGPPPRRGQRRPGDLVEAPAGSQLSGEQRGTPSIEVRIAREALIERLERLRGLEQQRGRVAAAALRVCDLSAQQLQTGALQLVERPDLRSRQQLQRDVERARLQAGLSGGERPFGAQRGVLGQRDRAP